MNLRELNNPRLLRAYAMEPDVEMPLVLRLRDGAGDPLATCPACHASLTAAQGVTVLAANKAMPTSLTPTGMVYDTASRHVSRGKHCCLLCAACGAELDEYTGRE